MQVTFLSDRAWWLARRMETAGHTVKAFVRARGLGDGFLQKHGGPVVPDSTELLVIEGDFPGPLRMAQARKIPVIGGMAVNPAWLSGVQKFRQREQALAYVATHQGPWVIDGQAVGGPDAQRLLTWCSAHEVPMVVRRAGDGPWVGAFFGGRAFTAPWFTWTDAGERCTARALDAPPEGIEALAPKLARDGFCGWLGLRIVRGQPVEASVQLPPAVGALLDGDLASQFVRLAAGDLGTISTRPDPVTLDAVRVDRPVGYPLGSDWLAKDAILDGVKMGREGVELIDARVGWRPTTAQPPAVFARYTQPAPPRSEGRDGDATVEDGTDSAPASWG